MPVLKPRSRMISIRLSEEEYFELRRLCAVTGARSVSDLARDALHLVLGRPRSAVETGSQMEEFLSQMNSLNQKVERLTAELSVAKATAKE